MEDEKIARGIEHSIELIRESKELIEKSEALLRKCEQLSKTPKFSYLRLHLQQAWRKSSPPSLTAQCPSQL